MGGESLICAASPWALLQTLPFANQISTWVCFSRVAFKMLLPYTIDAAMSTTEPVRQLKSGSKVIKRNSEKRG